MWTPIIFRYSNIYFIEIFLYLGTHRRNIISISLSFPLADLSWTVVSMSHRICDQFSTFTRNDNSLLSDMGYWIIQRSLITFAQEGGESVMRAPSMIHKCIVHMLNLSRRIPVFVVVFKKRAAIVKCHDRVCCALLFLASCIICAFHYDYTKSNYQGWDECLWLSLLT